MKRAYNKLKADAIGIALASLRDHLEQVCAVGVKPSFVMDPTARTGP